MNLRTKTALPSLLLALTACSSSLLQPDRIDYKSAQTTQPLTVPPDLTQLSIENRYAIPGAPVSALSYQQGQAAQVIPVAVTNIADVRIERAGDQRWLHVKRPAEQLWDPIRDFWQENGFLLAIDQRNVGIMETDWAENRAQIEQDFIRGSLGKLFDSFYSTSERDKFRTRLERTPSGDTEIYISHRGMVEVYTTGGTSQTAKQSGTGWQPRPADPELETEFLRRLMIKLGVSQEQAKAVTVANKPKSVARASTVNGRPVVLVDEGFDRAWRRVGLSLDRTGFTVEDRDRAAGTYFVRYVEPNADKSEPGFIAKLLGGTGKSNAPVKYRVVVRSQDDSTVVSVLDSAGAPDGSANAQRIVNVIAQDLQ